MGPKRSPRLSHRNNHQQSATTDSPVFRFEPVQSDGGSYNFPIHQQYQQHQNHQPAVTATATVTPTAMASDMNDPWTMEEHQRFLDGLEKYGCGQSTSVFAAWHAITATVGTRTFHDVKSHAKKYYLQLQVANAEKRKEYLMMQQIDPRWTRDQDAALEEQIARHINTSSVAYPWEMIASQIPHKSARDVRERYMKLCYDISRIESGQHVMMHLARFPRGKQTHSDHAQPHTEEGVQPIDCVVALTPQEAQILLRALEQVPVPTDASPDVLASVASAVAALACANNRKPPQRTTPLFTLDDARRALQRAVQNKLADPHHVLDLLASELRFLPSTAAIVPAARQPPRSKLQQQQKTLYNPSNTFNLQQPHRQQQQQLRQPAPIAATAGFAFGCLSPDASSLGPLPSYYTEAAPSPLHMGLFADHEKEATQELLNLRTSPVHGRERATGMGQGNGNQRFLAPRAHNRTPRFTGDPIDANNANGNGMRAFSFASPHASSSSASSAATAVVPFAFLSSPLPSSSPPHAFTGLNSTTVGFSVEPYSSSQPQHRMDRGDGDGM